MPHSRQRLPRKPNFHASARYEDGILEVRIPYAGRRALKVPVDLASGEKPALKAAG